MVAVVGETNAALQVEQAAAAPGLAQHGYTFIDTLSYTTVATEARPRLDRIQGHIMDKQDRRRGDLSERDWRGAPASGEISGLAQE